MEALCKIGSSTKGGKAKGHGYTGEKGVGFKSVFKVAHVVWIRSGHYSFKFVKAETLGMLTPIWAEFPTACDPRQTTIRLEMMPEYSAEEVARELRALDVNILLFLRRLSRITISARTPLHDSWTTSMGRDDAPLRGSAGAPLHMVSLGKDTETQVHLVSTYLVQDIPPEPKRAGIHQSKITLAFPITGSNDGQLPSQFVYASLPIRDFGFKVCGVFCPVIGRCPITTDLHAVSPKCRLCPQRESGSHP